MRRGIALMVLALVGLVLAGCGGSAAAGQPPKIDYGRDTCSRCNMIISEERFAAGLVAPNGAQQIFDDAGEMVATVQEQGFGERRAWVHDHDNGAWVDATTAFYVSGSAVQTPMGGGLVAFGSRDTADAYAAAHGGTVMAWSDVLARWTMPHMSH